VGRATIAVIGSIGFAKGAALVREAARIIRSENLPVRLLIIGEMALDFHDPAIVVTGRYVRTELPDLVEQHGVQMVWFPSIWPETFSYVTEEVMDMGLPIACFDIGAPAERVRAYERGLVIDRRDARRALIAMIDRLKPARAA
jgi:glycosyltransferase involved in cell wall biosynthesis